MQWQRELDSILGEGERSARRREASAFDEAAGSYAGSIVIVGAGNLGRRVLQGLRSLNQDVIALADSNSKLWNLEIEEVPVLSPECAARKYGSSAVFVVCIWHPDRQEGVHHHIARMKRLGATRTLPFVWLFWKYPDTFLPYYLWDLPSKIPAHAEQIRRACGALSTDCDRSAFVSHLAFRSRADFARQIAPSPCPAYFPSDLFDLLNDEAFVDCGAFDGDTMRSFLEVSGGQFSCIHAFESDPVNFAALQEFVRADEKLRSRTALHQQAVSSRVGTVGFSATAEANAAISDMGELEVECTTLDESLRDESPTFIKMDIEGAEVEALQGARAVIARQAPILAICIYHRQSDLWCLPLLMQELQPDSLLSLRSYWLDGFDLVCYAVPPHRRKPHRGAVVEEHHA